MKFKKLTKEQIIISIDRLTRFKPTKENTFEYLLIYLHRLLLSLK